MKENIKMQFSGPYHEGSEVVLVCEAGGGKPTPQVSIMICSSDYSFVFMATLSVKYSMFFALFFCYQILFCLLGNLVDRCLSGFLVSQLTRNTWQGELGNHHQYHHHHDHHLDHSHEYQHHHNKRLLTR